MSIGKLIASSPLWLIFVATMTITLVFVQVGISVARFRAKRWGMEKDSTVATAVAASAGLLAFILTFTFGMATDRFSSKNELLLKEVTAIETTYLRAGLIPEPHKSEVRALLKEYIDIRVRVLREATSTEDVRAMARRSEGLQRKIWAHAEALADENLKNADIVSLFVDSLNNLVETQTERVTVSLIRHIPTPIWGMLVVLFIFSSMGLGYQFAMTSPERTYWIPIVLLALSFSCVFLLIANLDREIAGKFAVTVNQQPLFELFERIGRMQ